MAFTDASSYLSGKLGYSSNKQRHVDHQEFQLLGQLKDLFARKPEPMFPSPETAVVAIGDIHGCLGLMHELLRQITDWLDTNPTLIFLGDVIDRGSRSADVIDEVRRLMSERPGQVDCLMGNHEQMLLDFLDGADSSGRWLDHGGAATLMSFGVEVVAGKLHSSEELSELRKAAADAIGDQRLRWIAERPHYLVNGDVILVHAAWEPNVDAEAQVLKSLLWGNRNFYRKTLRPPPFFVHGHVVTRPPHQIGARFAVDSGAYMGGGLSALRLAAGEAPEFRTSSAYASDDVI